VYPSRAAASTNGRETRDARTTGVPGSGHFLLAAGRHIAADVARLRAVSGQPTPAEYRHALREVVSRCLYGADVNPMAVGLCKTALWLEAQEPGRPPGFLDAHIQCGTSLVGLFDPASLEEGIPEAAYKPLTGDDRATCVQLRRENRQAARRLDIDLRITGGILQRSSSRDCRLIWCRPQAGDRST
jgi:hypothetical protein